MNAKEKNDFHFIFVFLQRNFKLITSPIQKNKNLQGKQQWEISFRRFIAKKVCYILGYINFRWYLFSIRLSHQLHYLRKYPVITELVMLNGTQDRVI